MRPWFASLLLALVSACAADAPDTQCGHKTAHNTQCGTGEYCVCYAGSVAVDEREFPGCVQPTSETDTSIDLSSAGASGACQACSYTAYCGAGRTWEVSSCTCQPPLAIPLQDAGT